jgi:hypothetical protein
LLARHRKPIVIDACPSGSEHSRDVRALVSAHAASPAILDVEPGTYSRTRCPSPGGHHRPRLRERSADTYLHEMGVPVITPAEADPASETPSPRSGLVCLGLTHSLMIAYPAPNSIAAVTVV